MSEQEQVPLEKKDRFAAARAALAAKRAAAKEAGVVEAEEVSDDNKFSMEEKVWLAGLTSAMRSREVKIASDVAHCIPVADAVLKAFSEKFPE